MIFEAGRDFSVDYPRWQVFAAAGAMLDTPECEMKRFPLAIRISVGWPLRFFTWRQWCSCGTTERMVQIWLINPVMIQPCLRGQWRRPRALLYSRIFEPFALWSTPARDNHVE